MKVRLVTLKRSRELIGALVPSPVDGKGACAPARSRRKPRGGEGEPTAPALHGERRDFVGERRVSRRRALNRMRRAERGKCEDKEVLMRTKLELEVMVGVLIAGDEELNYLI